MLVEGLPAAGPARAPRSCGRRSRRPGSRASGTSAPARRRAGRCTRRTRRARSRPWCRSGPASRMKSESSVRGSTSASCVDAVDPHLHARPASTSARRVSSATSARRCGSSTVAAGERRGLARARAVAQRRLGARRARPAPSTATAAWPRASTTAAPAVRRSRRGCGAYSANAVRAPSGSGGTRSRSAARRARSRSQRADEELGASVRVPAASAARSGRRARAARPAARAAGSACATEPPTVPRARVAAWPTWRTAWASSGQCRATSGERSSAAWRTVAPIRSVPLAAAQHAEAGDRVDVDEPRGPREPQVEQRHQALAAGEHARVLARAPPPPPRPSAAATYSNGAGFTAASRRSAAGTQRRGRRRSTRRRASRSRTRIAAASGCGWAFGWRGAGGCGRPRARASR